MNENNYYRDYLQNIQRGMQAVLEVKREALRKRSCEDE